MAKQDDSDSILKAPARVLGCLRPGYLRVIVFPGYGLADGGVPHDIPVHLVPTDLRLPNSEFTLVLDRAAGQFIAVEPRGIDQ